MNIGHARRKITPQGDIYLIGYRNLPNRLEPATGVHDDVFANAILFQQGEREVFLFNADVLEFEESMAEEVKTMLAERYGIDRDCVLLSATHDHTSIVAYHRSWWTGKFDENYYRWFLDTIANALRSAAPTHSPRFVAWASGSSPVSTTTASSQVNSPTMRSLSYRSSIPKASHLRAL